MVAVAGVRVTSQFGLRPSGTVDIEIKQRIALIAMYEKSNSVVVLYV